MVFLASDDSAFMSGQTLIVDGGSVFRRSVVMSSVPVIDLAHGARDRPRRAPGGGPCHRRRLPRDRLLRHPRPAGCRTPSCARSATAPTSFSPCLWRTSSPPGIPSRAPTAAILGGRRDARFRERRRRAAGISGVLPRRPRGRLRRCVLHGAAGPAALRAEPGPAAPAGFETAASAYYRAMSEQVRFLMRLAALALEVEERFLSTRWSSSIGTMRLNYYPAQIVPPEPGQLRASAHTDYGGFTILSRRGCAGGDSRCARRENRWVNVTTSPTTFVVNIGDLLMRWTNDQWLSNLHRVVNPPATKTASGRAALDRLLQSPELRRPHRVPSLAGAAPACAGALRRVPRREVRQDGTHRRESPMSTRPDA